MIAVGDLIVESNFIFDDSLLDGDSELCSVTRAGDSLALSALADERESRFHSSSVLDLSACTTASYFIVHIEVPCSDCRAVFQASMDNAQWVVRRFSRCMYITQAVLLNALWVVV